MHKIRESLNLGYTEVHRGDGSVSLVAPKLGKIARAWRAKLGGAGASYPAEGKGSWFSEA